MAFTAVSSLILLKGRRILIEVFPPSLMKHWKEWELRVLVLLSLTLQILLIILGNRRKYVYKLWIKIIVWSSYLMADSVATTALGVISSVLGDVYKKTGALDANIALTAFWAPFLLLHLGGPDTITAYSLEDNELWSRHLLGLASQAGITLSIFHMVWADSHLSTLVVLMILAGLIKYGERTWVLRSASIEQLKDSISTIPDLHSRRRPKLIHKYKLNEDEGYIVRADTSVELPIDLFQVEENSDHEEEKLITAYRFLGMTKRLFLDAALSSKDRDICLAVLGNMSYKNVFKVIEMELGFMYDILYTKAMLTHTPWGIVLRFISFILTSIATVLFSVEYRSQKYSKVDLSITFVLLAVAILLEVYAALVLAFSDQTVVWLRKHKQTATSRAINSLSLFGSHRWSNFMGQYSLLRYFLKENPLPCQGILELIKMNEKLETQQYMAYHEVTDDVKKWMFEYFNSEYIVAAAGELSFTAVCNSRGSISLSRHCQHRQVKEVLEYWSTKVELEQSILVWHIATELCYYLDQQYFTQVEGRNRGNADGKHENSLLNCKMSKYISRYMMYLLVSPEMLPPGGVMGQISLRETCAEARKHLESFEPGEETRQSIRKERKRTIKIKACLELFVAYANSDSIADVPEISDASLLGKGCRLLENLKRWHEEPEQIWKIIAGVWMELLAYAATQCRGRQHAQQLKQGGELLTHLWLLMAHFGLTEHFKISSSPDIAGTRFL